MSDARTCACGRPIEPGKSEPAICDACYACEPSDVDPYAHANDPPPSCGHSTCRQNWIDNGSGQCVDPMADLDPPGSGRLDDE